MKHVLVLQHAWEDPLGSLSKILDAHSIASTVVQVETEPIPDPTLYNAVVALGGGQHVYDSDLHPYFAQEKEALRRLVEHDIPYLGICLGAQLLADALGGTVKRHTMAEIGFFDVQFTEAGQNDPLYRELPGHERVFHWHEDTFDLPQGAVLLATNEYTENQAFRYGRAYGLQYHIELDAQMLDTWLQLPEFKQDIIDRIGIAGYKTIEDDRTLSYPTYLAHTRILFENFLRIGGLM